MTRICGATSYEILAQDFNKALQASKILELHFYYLDKFWCCEYTVTYSKQ
jgi:hypothetical protein